MGFGWKRKIWGWLPFGAVLLLPLLLSTSLPGQRSAKSRTTPIAPPVTAEIELGDAAADLGGSWRFRTGDDAGWSGADLDDSAWGTIDLTPPPGTSDPEMGASGFIPGWTAQGHPGYTGYAWYRLRIDVRGARRRLALKMPDSFDDAYQVFVNGQKIGEFGAFKSGGGVTAYPALPRAYVLPPEVRGGPMTIAIRMWMDHATPFNSPDAGGMHGPPVLGHARVIGTQVRLDYDDTAHEVGVGFLEMLVLLLALAVALTHFWMDRTDRAYLWLALVSVVTLIGIAAVLLSSFTTVFSQTFHVFLVDVVAAPVRIGLWVLFWAYWFRLGRTGDLQRAVWSLVILLAAGTAMIRPPLYGEVVPVHASAVLVPAILGVKLALAALLLWVAYLGIRKQRSEGLLALPAVLLAVMANYQHELRLIHVKTAFMWWSFQVSLGTASTMLSLLLVVLMLSRRFLDSQRRQVQWRWEIAQAREVQQVLIPEKMPQVNGLVIEGDYRPAREVGGDFFQIIPHQADGSVLLIVGDVTGKGLCAGMLVALIVGVVQTAAQVDSDPSFVLRTLNDRLCGRGQSSATCLMMRITADGDVTLANAGHLPPYLNGNEMQMEGALPLGVISGMDFPVEHFWLEEGDVLMLMSDGVAEAQDEHGHLFGFGRVDEMARGLVTATKLATAAQEFGQEDDILVLRVEKRAARLTAVEVGRTLVST